MTIDLKLLVASAVLAWVMLIFASLSRSRGWTPSGFNLAMGNRDAMPEAAPWMARADRAAKNMMENLPLFAVLVLTAHVGGVPVEKLALPAWLFFGARLAYFPIYVLGIPYVRTLAWAVGIGGLAMIAAACLGF